jgi:Xaa-Pro aminopeptidase
MAEPGILDSIPLSELASRRARLRAALKDAVGLIFAGDHDAHDDAAYRPHRHFDYLTGIDDEPGAVLLIDPAHPIEARRDMLFLRPLNPELEKWDGYRLEITKALRDRMGFKSVFRLDKLPMMLHDAARRSKRLACLHPLAQHTQPISPDLEIFKRVAERMPGISLEDRTDLIAQMRSVKSNVEIAALQRAMDITARGFEAAMRSLKPGMTEFDLQEDIEHAYRIHGARALSFPTIAGSGVNSTVLHYRANDQPISDGDLVCIDSGAKWCGYSADITRTLPANGRFTSRQREVYEVVLKAQLAAIKAVKPGARMSQVDAAARNVITKAGLGDYFIHGIGHHLGLDTHDITPLGDRPLKPGCIVTIEPGIYIPDEKIGVRIEDDVLVTPNGRTVLSAAIPKTVEDVERAMRARGGPLRRSARRA